MKHKRNIWIMLYSLVLAAFTVYFLLDTFVIARVYSAEGTGTTLQSADAAQSSEVTKDYEDTKGSEVPKSSGTETEENTAGNAATDDPAGSSAGDTSDNTIGNSGTAQGQNELSNTETTENTDPVLLGSAGAQNALATTIAPVVTEHSYLDENICIVITEYEQDDTVIYVADVQLSSAEYLKTALAKGVYGRNVTDETSSIAEDAGAILAINGDYYGSQQRGYVIRNGVLYRSTAASGRQDLVIYTDGSFGLITEGQVSAEELLAKGARQVLSFGPGLVQDGRICVSKDYEVAKAMNSNPRTAVGIIDELHYVFVVADGRTSESEGLSVYELAEFMQSLGVKTAYNLDGGGSSTMYFNGNVVNNPTSNGRTIRERSVSDIVYIGY